MLPANRIVFGTLLAIASIFVAVLLVFVIDRATNGSEVLGDVTVGGVPLGGLGEFEASQRVRDLEEELTASPIPIVIAGRTFTLDPATIGFEVDEQSIVATAMENGRDGNIFGQFAWWLGHFGGDQTRVEVPYTFDETALAAVLDEWQTTGIDDPAYPGDVTVSGGQVIFSYPRAGTAIEMEAAIELVGASLTKMPRPTLELPTTRIEPQFTAADIDALVEEILALLSAPVTLVAPDLDRAVTIPQRVLAESLMVRRDDNTVSGSPEFNVTLLGEPMLDYVSAFHPYLETEPVDAQIIIDDVEDTVEIVPSVPVTEPDPIDVPLAAWRAINDPDRTAEVAYRTGREAELSTEVVESYGIKEKISEFTTSHACCQNRVINIQTIADAVDGAWILPGETFSLNDHVGKRTVEKGYVCAGALIGGEIVEEGEICIGGGTSQFTTTLYNAVFFAGLEDIYHFPHTIWFSRYPEGREATLGFPQPDLIFRNNTENVVVIKTSHTDTSITVKMFGDNGGLIVESGLSGRYNYTSPRKGTKDDPDVPVCEYPIIQEGTPGWRVDVYRYITYPDGTQTTEVWSERYEGYWELTGYNPKTPPGYSGPLCSTDEGDDGDGGGGESP